MSKYFGNVLSQNNDEDMINHRYNKTLLDTKSDEMNVIRWRCGINDRTKYNAGYSLVADFTLCSGHNEVLIDFDIDSMKLEIPGGIGSSSAYEVIMERADILEREFTAFISHLRECAEEVRLKNEILEL